MRRRSQLRDLIAEPFLEELHRFLWVDSSLIGNAIDLGWSCREHAWLTGLLAYRLGHVPLFVHGSACYVADGNARRGVIEFSQEPHSWVVVGDAGALDLSIRPVLGAAGHEIRFPVQCVFAGDCIPRGKAEAYFFDESIERDRVLADRLRSRGRVACAYLARESEHLHEGHLRYAAGWIGSPLTLMLDTEYGKPTELYVALLRHLCRFLDERAGALAGLSFKAAWDRIAADRAGAMAWALENFPLPAILAPAGNAASAPAGADAVDSGKVAETTERKRVA